MKTAVVLAAILAAAPLGATAIAQATTPAAEMPAGTYALDLSHGSLIFKVNHFGLSNYTARFERFDAKIEFDPKNIEKSKVTASVDPTSIHTAFPNPDKIDFDKELSTGEKWFNAGKFPAITFVSTKIEVTGENQGRMTGNLTMLGVTKPVELDVTFNGAYAKHPMAGFPEMGFSAIGTLKRSDWGLNTFVPAIGDDVQVFIEGEFPKVP